MALRADSRSKTQALDSAPPPPTPTSTLSPLQRAPAADQESPVPSLPSCPTTTCLSGLGDKVEHLQELHVNPADTDLSFHVKVKLSDAPSSHLPLDQ